MKALLIVFSVLGLALFYSWLTFKPYHEPYFITFAHIKQDFELIESIEIIDSILKQSDSYKKLQIKEYNICMGRGNFNIPPSPETLHELYKLTPFRIDRKFVVNIFRISVIFKIIDQNHIVSKEQVLKDFGFI